MRARLPFPNVNLSPATPTRRKGRFETTFMKLGTSSQERVSAKRWYAGSCGMRGSRNRPAPTASVVPSKIEMRARNDIAAQPSVGEAEF